MPSFIRNTSGGKAISGGALQPRGRRGNTNAVASYWSGGGPTGPSATGGIGAPVATSISGTSYEYLQFNSTGNLTVVSEGQFQIKLFGGGGSGGGSNGYNFWAGGGGGGAMADVTVTLTPGTYLVTVGAGSTDTATYPTDYYGGPGSPSSFSTTTAAGGAAAANGGGPGAAGAAGTQVNTFIGGASLFKAANGGNANNGAGGSGIGGNGGSGVGTAGSAAANTASGGGSAGGSSHPNLYTGTSGRGGSGIVYVRWIV